MNNSSVNILIVDDREENIIALEALLKRDGLNLISTTSPNEALRICWEKEISIALVDVRMPEMDGFELVEILKGNPRTKDMLVIFVTAISKETKYAIKGLTSGGIDYLYKPLDPYITTAKVDSFVRLVIAQREIKQKNFELERIQNDLIKAKNDADQSKRIKENFLANMSHEIRTPINGILGLSHLLKQTSLDDQQLEIVKNLEFSSESLLSIVNDILDISKIEAGKFKIVRSETNIFSLLTSIVALMRFPAEEKGIKLELKIDPNVPKVIMADPLRLNQIITNLVSNAIKFTTDGQVLISLNYLGSKGNTAQLQFIVKDTGIGIDDNSLLKIFSSYEQENEFTSQKYGGTGLGLSIVKKLVDLKGGTIEARSLKGSGSEFIFTNYFEVVKGAAATVPNPPVGGLYKFEDVSVLVAEDNTVNQFMITKLLKTWNIDADVVDDGLKVLAKLKEKDYDLILMDTHMPLMGGFETTHKIRKEFTDSKGDTPIISLSATITDEDKQAALDAGATMVLPKPFDPAELHRAIAQHTSKQSLA